MISELILLTTLLLSDINCLNNNNNFSENDKCDKPLFLTPYIESGQIKEAQKLAKVNLTKYNSEEVESYSGFITVNKTCNSNMFFWFFPAKGHKEFPFIVWLQGGPFFLTNLDAYFGGYGVSSMYGLFEEVGPYYINNTNEKLESRLASKSWTTYSSVLFIDNPVGVGFSFTDKDECYPENENDVRNDLFNFMLQFYKLFPYMQHSCLYVHGNGYAGKFATGLSYSILEHNKKCKKHDKIMFYGLIINNGFIDPINQLEYSKNLYQIGLIDANLRDQMIPAENRTRQLIINKSWMAAMFSYNDILTLMWYSVRYLNMDNYVKPNKDNFYDHYQSFITKKEIRCLIHVGYLNFNSFNPTNDYYLVNDFLVSVKPWLEEILLHHKVLLYNGAHNLLVSNSQIINYVEKLDWSIKNNYYYGAKKVFYTFNNDSMQYQVFLKTTKNKFLTALFRGAGQMVPADQPECTIRLLNHFVFDIDNNLEEDKIKCDYF